LENEKEKNLVAKKVYPVGSLLSYWGRFFVYTEPVEVIKCKYGTKASPN
jgi:hypothetical protein